MGLKLIPEYDTIHLLGQEQVDSWGLKSVGGRVSSYNCYIKGSESHTPQEAVGGKSILPSYDISFNGDVNIHVGDFIEVDNMPFIVLKRVQKKDLSRSVMITKITV